MSKEKEWPSNLGMLDWDTTKIVFTKRSLIEFLKYTGTTVDTNFGNIQKLPKYAQFGKFTASENPATTIASESTAAPATTADAADVFKPTRRVRTVPGGPSTDIFGNSVDDGVLAMAPPKTATSVATAPIHEPAAQPAAAAVPPPTATEAAPTATKHSSSLSNFWDADDVTAFKPTRRVRQNPGGQDHISGIF